MTIIVMMILVGVTVTVALKGGLFGTASEAVIKKEIAIIQEFLDTADAKIAAEKASNGQEFTAEIEEVLEFYEITNPETVILEEQDLKYIANVDEKPERTCYILEADKLDNLGVKSERGKGVVETDGKVKDVFIVNGDNKRVYYIKEGISKENEDIPEKENGKIHAIEDLIDLAIAVNNGETFEGQTITLERTLDFTASESYRTANPEITEYIDEDGNKIDINGDGIVDPIKTELTTSLGFTPIGFFNPQKNEIVSFKGNFDGKGNTISGLYINITEAEFKKIQTRITELYGDEAEQKLGEIQEKLYNKIMANGLFGAIESGENNTIEIKNLTLENTKIYSDAATTQAPIAITTGSGDFVFSNLNINLLDLNLPRYQYL